MAARYTKEAILSWVDDYFSYHDILSVTEELLGDGYRGWLIEKIVEVLREMDTNEIEECFEYNEDLTEKAVATIKKASRDDMVNAILDALGYEGEEEMFENISDDLEEEQKP